MNRGFGMVEAVVAISIAAAFIVVLAGVNHLYVNIALSEDEKIQSSFLSEEALEAARFLRDDSWTTNIAPLTTGTEYYLYWSGSSWEATTTPFFVGKFDRRIRFDTVYRDVNDNIDTGGTIDTDTRKVTATVSWPDHGATSTQITSSYITNLFDN